MANRIPRLGGELPTYVIGKPKKTLNVTKQSLQRTINGVMQAGYGSKNYVQQSPRENTGTPGTKNFVQRSPKESTGTPGTKNYVQRDLTSNSAIPRKRPVGPTR